MKLKNDEQDLLLRELMSVPNRTYLWVHLTLDLLERDIGIDKIGIVKATSHLPNTVDEAYDRILSQSRDSEEAKRILHIVVAAARPLTLKEMALALTIRENHQSYSDLDLRSQGWFHENIRDICGLLLSQGYTCFTKRQKNSWFRMARRFVAKAPMEVSNGSTHSSHKILTDF